MLNIGELIVSMEKCKEFSDKLIEMSRIIKQKTCRSVKECSAQRHIYFISPKHPFYNQLCEGNAKLITVHDNIWRAIDVSLFINDLKDNKVYI